MCREREEEGRRSSVSSHHYGFTPLRLLRLGYPELKRGPRNEPENCVPNSNIVLKETHDNPHQFLRMTDELESHITIDCSREGSAA